MSRDVRTEAVEPRVSLDDIKHRAEAVKSKAVSEVKGAADTIVGQEATRTLLIVAGVVVVAASLAFFLGARSVRAQAAEGFFGE